jgi:plastocyanin
MRITKILMVSLTGFLLICNLGGCNSTGQKPETTSITMFEQDGVNSAYVPRSIIVPVGTTVIWRNNVKLPHTITSNDGLFSSGEILPESSFNYTFTQSGNFAYHCDLHDMAGTVIVK